MELKRVVGSGKTQSTLHCCTPCSEGPVATEGMSGDVGSLGRSSGRETDLGGGGAVRVGLGARLR